ncbi:MAG: PKD domain-containing protein, partial [Anaerolineae bacterium]
TATSSAGCFNVFTDTVTVNSLPSPILQPISATVRVSDTLTFTDVGLGGDWREWNFGDGVVITTAGITASHHYSAAGTYTVILTSTNSTTSCYKSTQGTVIVEPAVTFIYLPLVLKNHQLLSDLVVLSIDVNPANPRAGQEVIINITIGNQGEGEANNFWVDLYIDPSRVPQVNDIWPELCSGGPNDLSCYGIAWWVTSLPAGSTLTLNSSIGFASSYSHWDGRLTAGTHNTYVQVDSYGRPQPYAAVLETHEANGSPYNNVLDKVIIVSP